LIQTLSILVNVSVAMSDSVGVAAGDNVPRKGSGDDVPRVCDGFAIELDRAAPLLAATAAGLAKELYLHQVTRLPPPRNPAITSWALFSHTACLLVLVLGQRGCRRLEADRELEANMECTVLAFLRLAAVCPAVAADDCMSVWGVGIDSLMKCAEWLPFDRKAHNELMKRARRARKEQIRKATGLFGV
jgi:hypothetical protein